MDNLVWTDRPDFKKAPGIYLIRTMGGEPSGVSARWMFAHYYPTGGREYAGPIPAPAEPEPEVNEVEEALHLIGALSLDHQLQRFVAAIRALDRKVEALKERIR